MGVSVGVMQPDPRTCVIETRCPHCHREVRGTVRGLVGEVRTLEVECDCGGGFRLESILKELDS